MENFRSILTAAAFAVTLGASMLALAGVPDGNSYVVTYSTYNPTLREGPFTYTTCLTFGANGTTMTESEFGTSFTFVDNKVGKSVSWDAVTTSTDMGWSWHGTVSGKSPKTKTSVTGAFGNGYGLTGSGKQVANCP